MTGYAFHPDAKFELRDAARYYEDRRRGLGKAFVAEIRRTICVILRNPQLGTLLETHVRRRALRRFPYNLIYSYENDTLTVLAVMHQKHAWLLAKSQLMNLISLRRRRKRKSQTKLGQVPGGTPQARAVAEQRRAYSTELASAEIAM